MNIPLRISPGLRFIKQNVPEVEILEYPTWQQYHSRLKDGWDIVGFSFYQNEIETIRPMIAAAREEGAGEVWAGNYGAMDYGIPELVDRVVYGPGEDHVAQLFGYRIQADEVEHPAAMVHLSILPGIRHTTFGLLHTERGCPYRCTFCSTPTFEPERTTVDIASIERLLRHYRRIGVRHLVLTDELFGSHPDYAEELSQLFARYRFLWWAQTRVELAVKHLDLWYERGMRAAPIGMESLNQVALARLNKQQKVEMVREVAERIRSKPGMLRIAYFMIGHEDMSYEETIEDALRWKEFDFDVYGATIITPYPRTPYWEEIDDRYGIFDREYRHYDQTHLVWRHPLITPDRMRELRARVKNLLNHPVRVIRRGIRRYILEEARHSGASYLWRSLITGTIASLKINDRQLFFFPKEEAEATVLRKRGEV